jgi:methylmalonyl-CoA mutase N-terminal domain/subunit
MSGYHIRESGGTAEQEIAFTFANAIAYLDEVVRRGVDIDRVAPTLYTFLSITMDFLPEVAKFRAARRVWAGILRDRYGATDPRSQQLRIFAFTAGSTFTAQQPLVNVVRATMEATAAALAGVQTMHVSAYDEALGVPTEAAATLALRTQQVVALESGLTETIDPLGGSYAIEQLTDELETKITAHLAEIDRRGGALACIESGWFAQQLADAAYEHMIDVESGARVVIGVNQHRSPTEPLDVFAVDPAMEAAQVAAVRAVRANRNQAAVDAALADLHTAAIAGRNVMEPTIAAVQAYATVGEVVAVLRDVHGGWTPTAAF